MCELQTTYSEEYVNTKVEYSKSYLKTERTNSTQTTIYYVENTRLYILKLKCIFYKWKIFHKQIFC